MRSLQVLRYFDKLRITHAVVMLNLSKYLVFPNYAKLSNFNGKIHFILIFQ